MILIGDVLEKLKELTDESVQCVVTSPPYFGLRDYGMNGQIGLEKTPEEYVARIVGVFREIKRVLRKDGIVWLNLGDSYAGGGRGGDPKHRKGNNSGEATAQSYKGLPSKNLIGIPWRVALALQQDGWILRCDIIWEKPNCMPDSCKDRPTRSHEYIFLLTKSKKYFYNNHIVMELAIQNRWGKHKQGKLESSKGDFRGLNRERDMMPEMRNKRSVWTIPTKPYKSAHFAVFPEALVEPCVLAGSKKDDMILDPFAGSGTTLVVAKRLGRKWIGTELNPAYLPLIERRLRGIPETLPL